MAVACLAWFALQVRTGWERGTNYAIMLRDIETFLPMCKERHRWSDRTKVIERPLFDGYLFARLDPRERLPLLQLPGVIRMLGEHEPEPVPASDIERIRILMDSGLAAIRCPLVLGQKVYIEHGPLAGLDAIVIKIKDGYRVIVGVEMLNRGVAVELDRDWLKPAAPAAPRPLPAAA